MENPVNPAARVTGEAPPSRLGRSVTIEHAAALLNVSRRTIYYRIREGRLQTIRTIGGSQRVLIHSLGSAPQATRHTSRTT